MKAKIASSVILTILFLSIFELKLVGQSNYYVSPSGNNLSNGNFASPWEDLQFALNQLTAGDTLNILEGTYPGKLDIENSGTSSSKITIRNYQNDQVVIDGSTLSNYEYLLNLTSVNFIDIKGLQLQNFQRLDAIGIQVINSSGISILDNEFSNIDFAADAIGQTPNSSQNSQPIIVFGRDPLNPVTDLIISGNSIHDCEVGHSECLSINGNVDGFFVSNNHVYDNTNIGIVAIGHEGECSDPAFDQARNGIIRNNLIHDNPSAYAAAGGIYIDGAKEVIVENNIVYNNDYGIEVGAENNGNAPNDPSASEITVRNNLVYNNRIAGIVLGGYDYPSTGKVETTSIRNNTCFSNDTDNTYTGEITISYVENSVIENNIFYFTNSEKVLLTTSDAIGSIHFDYNLFYSPFGPNDLVIEIDGNEYNEFNSYLMLTGENPNSVFDDPEFMALSVPGLDLHIGSSSPAIDAGNPLYTPGVGEIDIDNELRLMNGIIDCGADELFISTLGVEMFFTANLEGAFKVSGLEMESGITNLVPIAQPFDQAPWNYLGTENRYSTVPNLIDWVLVEARDSEDPAIIVEQKAGLLLNDGRIIDVNNSYSGLYFSNIESNKAYYFSIKPRNHLAVISSNSFFPSLENNYSFDHPTKVMGGASQLATLPNGNYGLLGGDWNADGVITIADFNGYLIESSSINMYLSSDFNFDSHVTVSDFNCFSENSSLIGNYYIRY